LTRVLVLDELWYPQGGGGELSTMLYVSRMIDQGFEVSILTNRNAAAGDLQHREALPFGESKRVKATLLAREPFIKKKIRKLIPSYDVVYLSSKLLYLAPWIRNTNSSLKIIVHLHDYQLICPLASMYSFVKMDTCKNIHSTSDCMRCTRKFEIANGAKQSEALLGCGVTLAWKWAGVDIPAVLDAVDVFFTVSRRQALLIEQNLGEFGEKFSKKNIVLYNPIDPEIRYVPPTFEKDAICLGFFGGDRYLKGFESAISLIETPGSKERHLKLLASRVSRTHSLDSTKFELKPSLDRLEMRDAFRRVWIVLFLSIAQEPLPYMIMEAQVRGRPVLTTNVGGAAENIVKDGFTGTVFDPGKPDEFQDLIGNFSAELTSNSSANTREISELSKSFFDARSEDSYDTFLKTVRS
jgi:glycosyltransferase involved in cell wall biosynthesis